MNTRQYPRLLRRRLKHGLRALNLARTRWVNAGRPSHGPSCRSYRLRVVACGHLLMVSAWKQWLFEAKHLAARASIAPDYDEYTVTGGEA